jgi:AraC-like DNA-binding protein
MTRIPALNDRHAGRALAALHHRPAAPWTVASVAKEAGSSRLHLAARALGDGDASVAAVAAQVGYGSEEGFSRAFKRQFGPAPPTWRQAQRRMAANPAR